MSVYISDQNQLPLWVPGRPVCLAADLPENIPMLCPGFNNPKAYIKKKCLITSLQLLLYCCLWEVMPCCDSGDWKRTVSLTVCFDCQVSGWARIYRTAPCSDFCVGGESRIQKALCSPRAHHRGCSLLGVVPRHRSRLTGIIKELVLLPVCWNCQAEVWDVTDVME